MDQKHDSTTPCHRHTIEQSEGWTAELTCHGYNDDHEQVVDTYTVDIMSDHPRRGPYFVECQYHGTIMNVDHIEVTA